MEIGIGERRYLDPAYWQAAYSDASGKSTDVSPGNKAIRGARFGPLVKAYAALPFDLDSASIPDALGVHRPQSGSRKDGLACTPPLAWDLHGKEASSYRYLVTSHASHRYQNDVTVLRARYGG